MPLVEVKKAIEKAIREKWDQLWGRYQHARQTRYFYPTQDKDKAKTVMQFTRLQFCLLYTSDAADE